MSRYKSELRETIGRHLAEYFMRIASYSGNHVNVDVQTLSRFNVTVDGETVQVLVRSCKPRHT